jgi:hypothetical protein
LWYETVDLSWTDACAQWKGLSEETKKPFLEQARNELVSLYIFKKTQTLIKDQYYADVAASGQIKKKKILPTGAPKHPKNSYALWLTRETMERIKKENPDAKGDDIKRLYSAE